MYKAPVLLNIGFSSDLGAEESAARSDGGNAHQPAELDYLIDQEFDIGSFCKSVGGAHQESSVYELQAVVTFERSAVGIPCYFVYLRRGAQWLRLSQ